MRPSWQTCLTASNAANGFSASSTMTAHRQTKEALRRGCGWATRAVSSGRTCSPSNMSCPACVSRWMPMSTLRAARPGSRPYALRLPSCSPPRYTKNGWRAGRTIIRGLNRRDTSTSANDCRRRDGTSNTVFRPRSIISSRVESRSARWRFCNSSSTCCGRYSIQYSWPMASVLRCRHLDTSGPSVAALNPSIVDGCALLLEVSRYRAHAARGLRGLRPRGAPKSLFQGSARSRHRVDRMPLNDDTIFEIAHHYRFQWEPAQQMHVLLYPEGMVQLPGRSGEILKRVNGTARVGDIVADLERAFPGADLRGDVIEFLEHAHGKGWIRTKES